MRVYLRQSCALGDRQQYPPKWAATSTLCRVRPAQSVGATPRSRNIACGATSRSSEQVQLLQPTFAHSVQRAGSCNLLVYLPGTDGTGNAISPQLPGLLEAGFDVRSLYIATSDRSDWEELTVQTVRLVRELLEAHPSATRVTLLAESFGGCLALRCAAAAPELFERMVLVNPATAFARSWAGVPSFLASTNLLSVFPEQLYQVAQAILLPFLVDRSNVGEVGLDAVRQMIDMQPPENRRVAELASSDGASARSRRSVLEAFESYSPAAAGSWRLSQLCTGDVSDAVLSGIRVPTLLISSAKDRLLDSLEEGARLERVMQNAIRVVLPKSGHTALLEESVELMQLLRWTNFLPADMLTAQSQPHTSGRGDSGPGEAWLSRAGNGAARASGPLQQQKQASLPLKAGATAGRQLVVASAAGRSEAAGAALTAGPADRETDGNPGATGELRSNSVTFSNGRPVTGGPVGAAPTRTDRSSLPARPASERRKSFQQQKEVRWNQPEASFDQLTTIFSPLREIVSPVVRGLDNLPNARDTKRPLLLVGNHARIGLYDMPFLVIELYMRRIKVRGLAHPGHWRSPLGSVFESFGAVKASPMAAYKLLKAGEAVLLFPGGGREVNKRKGEEYKLLWSEEPDFVRLAAKMGALVLPFASVGGDDAFDVALDPEEILATPLLGDATRALFSRLAPELDLAESVPPLTRLPGVGLPSLLPVPNLSRLYFRFMPPVDPAANEGILTDPAVARRVYAEVRGSVDEGIRSLLEEQRKDPKKSLPARLLDQFVRGLPAFDVLR